MRLPADQTERLLERGAKLLRRGRPQEASLVYGRILLRNPSHPEARAGRDRAEAAQAEREQAAHESLESAAEAVASGERDEVLQLIRDALREGGDPERAHHLLDRLDGRVGRIRDVPPAGDAASGDPPPNRRRVARWPRPVLACIWMAALALALASVASSFDDLVGRLAGPPVPTTTEDQR